MARRKTNKNVVIALLVVLMIVLAVGYAAFSETLTISGTANAKGTFDIEFQNAKVVKTVGANEENTKAEISADKNTLTVKAADLAYPGAGVEFSTDIVNIGSIPAKVEAITPTNITGNTSGVIKIKGLEVITTEHPVIEPGEKCNIHFTVEWPAESTNQLTEDGETVTFSLAVQYTQSTDTVFDGKASHDELDSTGAVKPQAKKLTEVIQASDYGKTINYSVEVNGKTYSDWKVLYNDGTNVQIIMSDFLPQTEIPSGIGLQKVSGMTYNVNGTSQSNLVSCLKTGWDDFAKGTGGATAAGGTTKEIMEASYQGKYGTSWDYSTAVNDPLYVSHKEVYQDCYGYWLALPDGSDDVYYVRYNGHLNGTPHNSAGVGIRPVVTLKSDALGNISENVTIQE